MARKGFLLMHLPSWVRLAQSCEASYADDLGGEEEEEIELE